MTELQTFIDAGKKLDRLINEEIEKASVIDEDALITSVIKRIESEYPALVETLARRHLYALVMREFAKREQQENI